MQNSSFISKNSDVKSLDKEMRRLLLTASNLKQLDLALEKASLEINLETILLS